MNRTVTLSIDMVGMQDRVILFSKSSKYIIAYIM
jgi:hypothetical protein